MNQMNQNSGNQQNRGSGNKGSKMITALFIMLGIFVFFSAISFAMIMFRGAAGMRKINDKINERINWSWPSGWIFNGARNSDGGSLKVDLSSDQLNQMQKFSGRDTRIDESFAASGISNVNVNILDALRIRYEVSPDQQFHVRGVIYQEGDEYALGIVGDSLSLVQTKHRSIQVGIFNWSNLEEEFVIQVPEDAMVSVQSKTTNAEIVFEVENVEDIWLTTTNGKVTVSTAANKIYVKATNGGINLDGVEANQTELETTNGRVTIKDTTSEILDAHSTNGAVEIDAISRVVGAETTNGSIRIDAQSNDEVVAKTSNGKIRVKSDSLEPQIELKTSNSDVLVELPSEAKFDYDVSPRGFDINGFTKSDFSGNKGEGFVSIKTSNYSDITISAYQLKNDETMNWSKGSKATMAPSPTTESTPEAKEEPIASSQPIQQESPNSPEAPESPVLPVLPQ